MTHSGVRDEQSSGLRSVQDLETALAVAGRSISTFAHILDFSSAADGDTEARALLPHPDARFDLIFDHGVFTRADACQQDRWLAELRRLAKPGGFVVLSANGEHAFQKFEENYRRAGGEPALLRERRDRDGLLFIEDDEWKGGPFRDSCRSTFHAPWYLLEHWGRYFRVRAYVPRGALDFQDILVLERPADVRGTSITFRGDDGGLDR